jgi:hypothetical protein
LKDDVELGGLARLALNLMAAVHLPRPVADREELPLGGVSDITNRGALDRLLVSELANDDLTLAVRIAVNEALYLRREMPPRNPPRQRFVLLDAGIRMWGVPRVFSLRRLGWRWPRQRNGTTPFTRSAPPARKSFLSI